MFAPQEVTVRTRIICSLTEKENMTLDLRFTRSSTFSLPKWSCPTVSAAHARNKERDSDATRRTLHT